ncbi:aspartyl-tRNA synthetase [Trichodelitschia bisporula]|uniref:Probable aspartate--tRNA ligase, cytoplasmic n=1 Tax=Trichodelitschia bisporula TaxID=703511 RepID=A0A6G1IB10_9PEZI|nr:aspartyl-tRNA synthetase [Trichodelitschia bisporula]
MSSEQVLPERPVAEAPEATEGGEKLSKKALKKLEKEKEKAEKKKAQQAADAAKKAEADANDVSKGKYGDLPMVGATDYKPFALKRRRLYDLGDVADGVEVLVRCDVATARSQSAKLAFLNLRDSLDSVQAVVAAGEDLSRQMVKFASTIPAESIVDVIGIVKEPKEPVKSATISNRELHITQLWTVSRSVPQLPIQVDDAEQALPSDAPGAAEEKAESGRPLVGLSTRLDNRVLDLRSTLNHAIFDIRSGARNLFQDFLRERGFLAVDSPKLLGSPSEGGANVFEVGYYGKKAYLAQSPQMYKQMLIAARYKRVMELGPVFRAENSNTSRHLSEYTSLDLEAEFVDDYQEVMFLIRDLLHHVLSNLDSKFGKQASRVRQTYKSEPFKLPAKPEDIPVITFSEGIQLLLDAGIDASFDDDINSTQEKQLGDLVRAKYNTDFYILTEYPLACRAFYTMPKGADLNAKFSNSYDFMMRGQEVLSGAQRIHDHGMLVARMKTLGLDPENPGFKDYVQAFSYGCPPHAGGAFGLERIVLNWLDLKNVRLATMFPRDPQRVTP